MKRTMAMGALGAAALAASAQAQSFSFEPPTYTGSDAGTSITGQDGWLLPAVAGSIDGKVYTYTNNALAFPANPAGNDQMAGGVCGGTNFFVRAQRNQTFGPSRVWDVQYDFIGAWAGPPITPGPPAVVAVDNLASWSLQDSTTQRSFQTLLSWGVTAVGPAPNATNHSTTGANYHCAIGYYPTAAATAAVFATPTNTWRDLALNNWYRVRVKWDFYSNKVLRCTIQNLTTGGAPETTDVSANNWYLRGGPGPAVPPATLPPLSSAMRLFVGGNGTGNTNAAAFDNLMLMPCYGDCNGSGTLTIADFGCFQAAFSTSDSYADCNSSGSLTIADFACFQAAFAAGCP